MKKFYYSKTMWINVIVICVVAIAALMGIDVDMATQTELAAAILAILNIILRIFTKEPIV